jgi:four helix bundle protein
VYQRAFDLAQRIKEQAAELPIEERSRLTDQTIRSSRSV